MIECFYRSTINTLKSKIHFMIRTFQVLLLAVISIYVVKLSMLILGYVTMWNSDRPAAEDLNGALQWQYSLKFGAVKLEKNYTLDTLVNAGKMTHSILIPGVTSRSSQNGRQFVLNARNEKVFLEPALARDSIILPINGSTYSSIKIIAVLFLATSFAMLIWMSFLLFRFTQSAYQKNFFTISNMKRLQTVGWIITGYGILSWLSAISIPFLIKISLHYKSITSVYSGFSVFPSWLITGMLLLLVAKAFEKGITLTEDNNSIV